MEFSGQAAGFFPITRLSTNLPVTSRTNQLAQTFAYDFVIVSNKNPHTAGTPVPIIVSPPGWLVSSISLQRDSVLSSP